MHGTHLHLQERIGRKESRSHGWMDGCHLSHRIAYYPSSIFFLLRPRSTWLYLTYRSSTSVPASSSLEPFFTTPLERLVAQTDSAFTPKLPAPSQASPFSSSVAAASYHTEYPHKDTIRYDTIPSTQRERPRRVSGCSIAQE